MNRTVSLLPQKSIGKYGPQDSEKATEGTPLNIVKFDDIITTCRNPKTKSDKKHQSGAIIAYVQDKLGVTDESVSGGMIFCDIRCEHLIFIEGWTEGYGCDSILLIGNHKGGMIQQLITFDGIL